MSPVDFILLRGLGRESAHWGSFFDDLQKQKFCKSVECIDLPGAGRFNKLTAPMTIAENAEFVISQLPEEVVEKKVIFSVSLGSMVAIEMLHKRPDLFSLAIVTNTSFSNLSPLYHRLQLNAFQQFLKIGRSGSDLNKREYEVLKMVSNSPDRWLALSKQWAEIADKRPVEIKNFLRQLLAAATYKLASEKPKVPIVALRSLGDKMVHPECTEKLANYWSLPMHSHPDAGHDLCIDDPAWVIEKIEKILGEK